MNKDTSQEEQCILEILREEGPTHNRRLAYRMGSYSQSIELIADKMADEGRIQRFQLEEDGLVWFAAEDDDAQAPASEAYQMRERIHDTLLRAPRQGKISPHRTNQQMFWLAAQIIENTSEAEINKYLAVLQASCPSLGFIAGDTWETRKGKDPGGRQQRIEQRRQQKQKKT